MTSETKTKSNGINSLESTGPNTPDGKNKSCLNAMMHGLSGSDADSVGLKSIAREEYERILEIYYKEYRPNSFEQVKLVETMAIESVRVDRCRATGFALEAKLMQRAKMFWHKDRLLEAEIDYAKLHKDPARWLQELESRSQGCQVLIHRWAHLQSSLKKNSEWTAEQRSSALDLCGVPLQMRDGVNAVDPDTDDLLTARLELCEAEVRRLNSLHEDHLQSDTYTRSMDEAGVFLMFTKHGALLERYENAACRRYDKAWKRLLELGCKIHVAVKRPNQASTTAAPPISAAPRSERHPEPTRPTPIPISERVITSARATATLKSPLINSSLPAFPEVRAPKPAAKLNRQQRRKKAALERRER